MPAGLAEAKAQEGFMLCACHAVQLILHKAGEVFAMDVLYILVKGELVFSSVGPLN